MTLYDLSKAEREGLARRIGDDVRHAVETGKLEKLVEYCGDDDTYVRKAAYEALAECYNKQPAETLDVIKQLSGDENFRIRQAATYAAGEIGRKNAEQVFLLLEKAMHDANSRVRYAVVGSLKRMGEKNPVPTLEFASKHARGPDAKVRQLMAHGIELRGRTHPEEALPILERLQDDTDRRVRETVVHVLSQISYKKGCLPKVIYTLKGWHNQQILAKALEAIIEAHGRYEKFSEHTQAEAKAYIQNEFTNQ